MHPVEVRVLGSGDAFGSGGRLQTCFYIAGEKTACLIDCGTSALIAMKRFAVEPSAIDAILLSHLHGDHFGGIPFLILQAQFSRRVRTLRVAGPAGVEPRIREAMEVLFPGSWGVPRKFPIEFIEYAEGQKILMENGLSVIPYEVCHPSGAPAYALKVSIQEKEIGYSGDTEWVGPLLKAAEGTDLFICESYCFEKKVKFHLDYGAIQAHRPEMKCRRLLLTHMSEGMLARLKELKIEWAEDGQKIDL
jgi:ribonuclease BN (tRNA processing enzyme)